MPKSAALFNFSLYVKEEILVANVYVINSDGSTTEMAGIRCKSEDLELQRILELNPNLMPGEQINPTDPRRWLIVKREMPVPDPVTGDNRWSIDFFFVDQDATPTFIECKRYGDTRAKREVIGQMFDYAANGHYYWSKNEMREYAEQSLNKSDISLEEEIKRLHPDNIDSVDEFFQRVEDNLREGIIRLAFFMEESSPELRSIVDFLNKQMELTEVLLIEARQYEYEGMKIVTPILFGYTEEARRVKKTLSITTDKRRKWDRESFFNDAGERLAENEVSLVKELLDKSRDLGMELSWGTGKAKGSFSIKWPHVCARSMFSVFSDGLIMINYGWFNENQEQKEFVSFFKNELTDKVNLPAPDDYEIRFPSYQINLWSEKLKEFLSVLELIHDKYPEPKNI